MRKRKTEHQKQEQCDRLIHAINGRLEDLGRQAGTLKKWKDEIQRVEIRLDDPHAVIPKCYKTMEEWMADNRWPHCLLGHVCGNRITAELMLLGCNTYQEDYHIVQCRPMEYYEKKFDKR